MIKSFWGRVHNRAAGTHHWACSPLSNTNSSSPPSLSYYHTPASGSGNQGTWEPLETPGRFTSCYLDKLLLAASYGALSLSATGSPCAPHRH